MAYKRQVFELMHQSQTAGAQLNSFNPEEYFCTIPLERIQDLDDRSFDAKLAHELFMGEYELSVSKEQSEMSISKRDFEALYFNPDQNVLNDKFIHNFDKFQIEYPPAKRQIRANTMNFVGFSKEG